jgi:SAM-dependent methyltransferase
MSAVLELEGVKQNQQRMWSAGDYGAVAKKIVLAAELLVDAADLPTGASVLDVAAGTGNASLAAARAGCSVTALDYVRPLLDRAAVRAAAERVELELVEGDAERIPFADASFDAVLSVFGVMFAPDQERAAAELARVCRPGGTIALASWTPEGAIGELFRLVGSYAPPPDGVPAPTRWGTEDGVRDLLGPAADVRTTRRECVLRYESPEGFADAFLTKYGPTLVAADRLDDDGRAEFRSDLARLAEAHSRRDDVVAMPAEYLEVVAERA